MIIAKTYDYQSTHTLSAVGTELKWEETIKWLLIPNKYLYIHFGYTNNKSQLKSGGPCTFLPKHR